MVDYVNTLYEYDGEEYVWPFVKEVRHEYVSVSWILYNGQPQLSRGSFGGCMRVYLFLYSIPKSWLEHIQCGSFSIHIYIYRSLLILERSFFQSLPCTEISGDPRFLKLIWMS